MTEETLFEHALRLPELERAALLAQYPDWRERVAARLAAHAVTLTAAGASLDPDATSGYVTTAATTAATTTTVVAGKYTLVAVIGEGGMGSVWRAQQTEPVKRVVAVKLIKAGMDSKQVLARFEAERQALAVMDHPNIAKVLDGGLHDGRPFFVMELVQGVPITDYCDTHRLNPTQRLELFVQACHALQHAHQKGIIHRDVKPSNVLVAQYDDKPVVKVIDFGVAKATSGTLTANTLDTGLGGIVGTPQYMSPEQATFNNVDIDTRSDVYALGVLLYELLTGSPPFSGAELKQKGLLEILRVVREDEPPRPSTKLSTADALPSISANRGTEPKKLTGLLRHELDWIIMKALEKDRTRRYETANGFAADVLRYLAGEPVLAHPPSRLYRWRKFVRRHRPQVLAASMVFAALLLGFAGTAIGLVRADAERRTANEERDAKAEALVAERAARTTARHALEEMTSQVMSDWLARQGTLTPEQKTFLERALGQFEAFAAETGDDTDTRAAVADAYVRVGNILARLGQNDRAVAAFDEARRRYEALRDEQPESPAPRAGLVRALGGRVDRLYTLARKDEAIADENELVHLAERLVADFPPDSERLELLWKMLEVRVGHLVSVRQFADAVAAADRLAAVHAQLYAGREATSKFAFAQARVTELGQFARSWQNKSPTVDDLRTLARQYDRAAVGPPPNANALFGAGVARLNLTITLRRAGRIAEAFDEYAAAERGFLDLIGMYPGVPEYRSFLGALYLGWADLARLEGQADAGDQARRAHSTYTGLLRINPSPKYEQGMATSEGLLALAHADEGRVAEAYALLTSAFARNERLIAARGAGQWTFGDLTFLHAARAQVHERQRDFKAAVADWEKAADYTLKNNKSDAPVRAQQAAALIRGGQVTEGLQLADQLTKRQTIPVETFRHLATAYAWAAAGQHVPPERVVEMLRTAAQGRELESASRRRWLREAPEFAPLRERDDFKKWLAELEAKQPRK